MIKDSTQLGCNPPAYNITEQPKNTTIDRGEAAVGHPHSDPPSNNAGEQSFTISDLPPPDLGDMSGEFESVIQHINPQSHIDDDDTQLIKDSTLMGYRNPPEAKLLVIPDNLKPVVDSVGYPPVTSDYRLHDQMWTPPITLSSGTSPSLSITPPPKGYQKFDKTHPEVSSVSALGQGQYANIPPGSDYQYHDTQLPNTSGHSGNTATASGPKSLSSVGNSDELESSAEFESESSTEFESESSTEFESLSHHKYNRQRSTPIDVSLTGEITANATGTTTSNRLPVSDHTPAVAIVSLTDQPTPEASQAPSTADSKCGKTNLRVLKNRFQHKKELTKTMVQSATTHSRPQPSGDYVAGPRLLHIFSDNTITPPPMKLDLPSSRSKLEKTKEEIDKMVVVANKKSDYSTPSDDISHIPLMTRNKSTVLTPQSTTANLPGSNTHSASSTSLKRSYRLWQCAHCQTVNEACHDSCTACRLAHGRMADRSSFCEFCQLMIFIPRNKKYTNISCPRCKMVF